MEKPKSKEEMLQQLSGFSNELCVIISGKGEGEAKYENPLQSGRFGLKANGIDKAIFKRRHDLPLILKMFRYILDLYWPSIPVHSTGHSGFFT